MTRSKVVKSIAVGMLCLTAGAEPLYRCEMTVGGYAGTSTLTDFPLLVRISPEKIDQFSYDDCAENGADVSFTDADSNVLPHEIDTWNPNGESLVWVKLPSLSGKTTKFTFRWKDAAPPANDPTRVWPGYVGVWHFNSYGENGTPDSTSHGFTATNLSSWAWSSDTNPKNGSGALVGLFQAPDYEPTCNVGGTFSVSGWVYGPTYPTEGQWIGFASKNVGTGAGGRSGFLIEVEGKATSIIWVAGDNQKSGSTMPNCKDVTKNWQYFTMACNGSKAICYLDGAKVGEISKTIGGCSSPFTMGGKNFRVDEYRVRQATSSADWIKAEYTQMTTADFVSAGETEVYAADGIAVGSAWGRHGVVSPDYGVMANPVAGETYTFTCTDNEDFLDETETERAFCTGWELLSAQDGNVLRRSSDPGEAAFSCSHVFRAGEGVVLRWLWHHQFKVTAVANGKGTVTPTEAWVDDGGSISLSAEAEDENSDFFRWNGASNSQDIPLVVNVTRPMELMAQFASTVYVSTNGSDEASGTFAAPYASVEKAIAATGAGSTIYIGEGTYKLTQELMVTNDQRLVGAGRDKTILDAQSKRRVMTINSTFAHVSGVTIRNGATTTHGGGVKIIGNGGVLEDCTVTTCNDTQYDPAGGGIYMSSSKGVISRCIIKGNSLPKIYYSKGAGVYMNAGRMDNSLIVGNTSNTSSAGTGAAIFADGSAVIRNCTIVDNETTTAKCGGLYANNANVRVINCVLWGNRAPKDTAMGAPDWREASTANFDHCVAPTKPSGEGCKNDDPSFKGASSGDYTVYSSSSLRNAGKDLADIGELDLNGNPRVSGQIDVGCYEFDESQKEVSFGVVPLKTLVGGAVAFSNTSVGFTDEATHAFTLIDEYGAETAVHSADEAGFTSAEPGLYSVRLVVTEGGRPYELTLPKYLLVAPLTNYVDVAATAPRSPYGTPETAATNVLNVIPYAMDGSTVFVKDGLYKLWKEVRLDDAITMISENGAERAILKRTTSGNYRPLRINHAQALVRGFTMTGGEPNDAGGGGVLIDVHGGTLEDSIVTNNSDKVYDSNGGGVYIGGGGKVRRCLIGWNKLSSIHYNYGGGVRMGSGLLEDCLVISNRTLCNDSRPEFGGGVCADGGTVRNCTIIGNKSYNLAGGLYQKSGATVYNCVIRDNYLKLEGGSEATKNFSFEDPKKVLNCALPVAGGLNSVTNEPAFKDAAALDFHPAQGSPLINAGTNVNYTAESVDLEGNPRIFNFGRKSSRPDIGCYETPWGTPGFLLLLK